MGRGLRKMIYGLLTTGTARFYNHPTTRLYKSRRRAEETGDQITTA
jgi:hypothetical protein